MKTIVKAFHELTADDVMSAPVVPVAPDMTLRTAARVLERVQATGAPVVDESGQLVGVLSATDFLSCCREGTACPKQTMPDDYHSPWQLVSSDCHHEELVREHMTKDPVTASASTSVTRLARRMLDAHIHRIVIVDEKRRPIGIVSTTDMLAAIAYAEDRESELEPCT